MADDDKSDEGLRRFYGTLSIELLSVRIARLAHERNEAQRLLTIATEVMQARVEELERKSDR